MKATPQAWTLEIVGSQVAFKGVNGKYLSRCNNCWVGGAYPNSVFVHLPDRQAASLWTPIRHASGKYLFKSDNGQFLARCDGCVTGNTNKFVFLRDAIPDDTWAQWSVDYTHLPRLGTKTIQADNGGYLRLCTSCGGNNGVTFEAKNDVYSQWIF